MTDVPLVSIVDDDPSVRKAIDRLCKSVGYRVELYDSSESFLNANAVDRTGCLILDNHLPGKSGLELQTELMEAGKRCPIVFITAVEDEFVRVKAMQEGAIDFLGKPPDIERLLEVIEQALRSSSSA